jgi:SAM-dependent methyltransferase
METLGLQAGERVVDVGCGFGVTSVELAHRVGPGGRVLAVDVSAPMLARARARAANLPQVTFVEGDAQVHPFPPGEADALFSRFGVMFFADPVAAFANLRRALRAGGRLGFVCWQAMDRNPWRRVPVTAIARVLTLPPPPPPDAPGPFAFGDADRVRGILDGAGWHDVAVQPLETEVWLGATADLDATVRFVLDAGPAASALRAAGDRSLHAAVTDVVRGALAPFHQAGGVRMPAAAWVVTARA